MKIDDPPSAVRQWRAAGSSISARPAAIDVTRSTSSQPPRAFTAGDVHDHVRASLAGLGLPGLHLADQVFVTEAAAGAGTMFRRAPGDPSLLATGEETVVKIDPSTLKVLAHPMRYQHRHLMTIAVRARALVPERQWK